MSNMARVRNVVVAMDGSQHSIQAFQWYMENVHKTQDHVIIVHCPEYRSIIDPPMMSQPIVISRLIAEEDGKIKELLNDLGDRLRDTGIGGKVKSVGGVPGEVIVKVAREEQACMIVMGARGLGRIRQTLLGTVSDYVLNHSHVPVTVYHSDDNNHKR